jgi:hypothetical protein
MTNITVRSRNEQHSSRKGHPEMPFKSQAQRRKFAELLVAGKISPDTFEEWNRETGSKRLPERVKKRSAVKSKRSSTKAKTKTR